MEQEHIFYKSSKAFYVFLWKIKKICSYLWFDDFLKSVLELTSLVIDGDEALAELFDVKLFLPKIVSDVLCRTKKNQIQ